MRQELLLPRALSLHIHNGLKTKLIASPGIFVLTRCALRAEIYTAQVPWGVQIIDDVYGAQYTLALLRQRKFLNIEID
jgi:hypothetical protein